MSSRMDDIVKRIEECGYDADKFTLSLSLPISLAIRFLFNPSIYIKNYQCLYLSNILIHP